MLPALTPAERAGYEAALTGVYLKRIRVSLLERNGQVVEDLTAAFMDGTVTVDDAQDVSRACELQVLDPRHRYGFDADTYQGSDLTLSRLIRVWWIVDPGRSIPGLTRPISVPVHTGPITGLRRDGPVVRIEAQGKEVYGLSEAGRTLTIRKGAKRTDALRTLASAYLRETRTTIPDLPARLGDTLVVRPKDQPWKVMQRLAESLGRQLFYDGAGTLVLRQPPGNPTWRFSATPRGGLTSFISSGADLSGVVNRVRITGRDPRGKKSGPVTGVAVADPAHPLSPAELGQTFTETRTNTHLRTRAECDHAAQVLLARRLRLVHTVSFNAAPVPHLDPGDLIRLDSTYETAVPRLDRFTLPLGLGGDMAVGYTNPYRLRETRRKADRRG